MSQLDKPWLTLSIIIGFCVASISAGVVVNRCNPPTPVTVPTVAAVATASASGSVKVTITYPGVALGDHLTNGRIHVIPYGDGNKKRTPAPPPPQSSSIVASPQDETPPETITIEANCSASSGAQATAPVIPVPSPIAHRFSLGGAIVSPLSAKLLQEPQNLKLRLDVGVRVLGDWWLTSSISSGMPITPEISLGVRKEF
jgi:hypothetical protein